MVLPNSHRISRVQQYLGVGHGKIARLSPTGLLPSMDDLSRSIRLDDDFVTFRRPRTAAMARSRDPSDTTHADFNVSAGLGLYCSPFARRYWGNRFCFLFLGVLRCFSSPGSPPAPMYSTQDDPVLPRPGFPIRKSPDQCLLAAPRSLSQLATSFIAFRCQGIRPTPLVA